MRLRRVQRSGQITLDAVITGATLLVITATAYVLFISIIRDYLWAMAAGSIPVSQ